MAMYHHRCISRIKGEELLLAAGKDGSFLVRDSETVQGAYTLCLLFQGVVKQYRILPDCSGMLYVQAEQGVKFHTFPDISQLIENYIQRGKPNGLICPLKHPVSPDLDSDEEEDLFSNCESISQQVVPDSSQQVALLSKSQRHVVQYIKQRYEKLDMSSVDGSFASSLKQYAEQGVLIDTDKVINNGVKKAQLLQQVLYKATSDLNHQFDVFLSKVDLCSELFDPLSGDALTRNLGAVADSKGVAVIEDPQESLDRLFTKLESCRGEVIHLEEKAVTKLKQLYKSTEVDEVEGHGPLLDSPPQLVPKQTERPKLASKLYEVKSGRSNAKMLLTVDIAAGKLLAVKEKQTESLDENCIFVSDRIMQLIKSSKNNCGLEVKIKDRKSTEKYVFPDARECESFCQMVKQMKMMHNIYSEVDHLTVFVGTWNMAENTSPWNLGPWLKCQGVGKTQDTTFSQIPYDMYVIGTQESSSTDKDWVKTIRNQMSSLFGIDMYLVESESLWQIRMVILVKPEYKDKISHVTKATVATGLANTLGNKGGVGISLTFNLTSFCFITGHLAARHDEKRNAKRNQNYRDIIKNLNLGPKQLQGVCDLTNRFHHVFFLGDFNYRVVDLEPEAIISVVKQQQKTKNYESLLQHDQLKQAQKEQKAFLGFEEEAIMFPPTYKFQKGSLDNYSWEKVKKSVIRINAPSWCDRVLWKSYPETHVYNTSYGSVLNFTSSDHKPVFASFEVGIQNQTSAPAKASTSGDLKIAFDEVNAEVKRNAKERMQLEIYSGCLESVVQSDKNKEFMKYRQGYNSPRWKAGELPQLKPLFEDLDYLEEQFLIIAVKSEDGMESYGECVVSLKSATRKAAPTFNCLLTHQGEATGRLWGIMFITSNGQPINTGMRSNRMKSYELVSTDTDLNVMISPVESATQSPFSEPYVYSDASEVKRQSDLSSVFDDHPPVELRNPNNRKLTSPTILDNTLNDSNKLYMDICASKQNTAKSLRSTDNTPPPMFKRSPNLTKRAGTKTPPVSGGHDTPPLLAGRDTPPIHVGRDTPPIHVGRDTPPIHVGRDTPPIPTNHDMPPVSTNCDAVYSDITPPQPCLTSGGHHKEGHITRNVNITTDPTVGRPPLKLPHSTSESSHPKPAILSQPTHKPPIPPSSESVAHRSAATSVPNLPPRRPAPDVQTTVARRPSDYDSDQENPHLYSGAVFQRVATIETRKQTSNNNNYGEKTEKNLAGGSSGSKVKTEISAQYARSNKMKKEWPKSMIEPPEENPLYGEKEIEVNRPVNGRVACQMDERDPAPPVLPPVLPPRKTRPNEPSTTTDYEVLPPPVSLERWLQGLQLSQYTSTFQENGWDRIEYLDDLNKDDLNTMNICDPQVQKRILVSIKEMQSK